MIIYLTLFMKKHTTFLFFSILLLAANLSVSAQEEQKLMQGTEKAKFQQTTPTTGCYVFGKYTVKTISNEDSTGENIEVFRHVLVPANAKTACRTSSKPYLSVKNPDANYFIGLAGDYLFIDSGTSVESRGLEIYNISSRKSIFTSEYHDTVKLLQNRYVVFDKISVQNGSLKACPKAREWKRDGFGIGWVRDTRLDLQTLKETPAGALRCIAQQ